MRKEIIIAIVVGILFGVAVAYGVWRANSAIGISNQAIVQNPEAINPKVQTPTPHVELTFTTLSPIEYQVFSKPVAIIEGITRPNVWIMISSENKDIIVRVKTDGKYREEATLVEGVNQIVLSVFDESGNSYSNTIPVFYSDAFQPVSEPNQATAYMGIVTDKTESSMQMKDEKGAIRLLSIEKDNAIVEKTSSTGNKSALYSDIAIGDYIIAMGTKEQNGMLLAKNILLTSVITKPNRNATHGTVSSVARKNITVTDNKDITYTVEFDAKAVITEGETQNKSNFSDLEEGQEVIISGIQNGTSITANRLQIL